MRTQEVRGDRLGVVRRLSVGLIAGIAVLTAAILVLTAVSIVQDYRDAIRQAKLETRTIARALEQHSERVFDAIRFRLQLVRSRIGSPDWDELAGNRELERELVEMADRPFLHSVRLFDETGRSRVASRSSSAALSRAANRDYFIAQNGADRGLFIGRPIMDADDPVFGASMRLEYPDGRFAGVVAAFIPLAYFEAFYREVQLRHSGVIELIRDDGAYLLRHPSVQSLDTLDKPGDLLREMADRQSGTYRAQWPIDGIERIASFRRLDALPILVTVAVAVNDALRGWRLSLIYRLSLAGLALATIIGFGRMTVLRARAVESEVGRHTLELERSIREKEVLLREVHHRVKNNLQMIASMMRLTSRKAPPDAQPVLADVARRVTAIGQAYNHLYRAGQVSTLNLAEYIDMIAQGVASGFGAPRMTLRTELAQMIVDIDTALPVGLVALELVTNAYKHAFPGEREGEIVVKLRRHEEFARLVVADNGIGPQRRNPAGSGLMLIEALAGQVDGKLKTGPRPGGGTKARLTFKLVRSSPRMQSQPDAGPPMSQAAPGPAYMPLSLTGPI